MNRFKMPDLTAFGKAFIRQHERTGYTAPLSVTLGKMDGGTVTDPNYPYPDANLYVWYNANGREDRALMGPMSGLMYTDDLYGLEVIVATPPTNMGYAPGEKVVIGTSAQGGRFQLGGTDALTQYITNIVNNNTYITGDKLRVLRVEAATGMDVYIIGGWAYPSNVDNTLTLYSTETLDVSAGVSGLAAGEHCLGIIAIDMDTGLATLTLGTPVTAVGTLPARDEFTYADVAAIDIGTMQPCGVVYFYFGQTSVVEADILRDFEVKTLYTPPHNMLLVLDPSPAGTYATLLGQMVIDNRGIITDAPTPTFVLGQTTNYVALATDVYVGIDLTGAVTTYVTLPPLSTVELGHEITVHDQKRLADPTHVPPVAVAVIPDATVPDTIDEWYIPATAINTVNMFGAGQSNTFQVVENSTGGKMWHIKGTARAPLFVTQSQIINMGAHKITEVTDPTNPQDAATKAYVDSVAGGGSPLTTKGDVYGFSTVNARIPIGANGEVLTADNTQTLGLKWAAATGGATSPLTTKGDLWGFSTVDARLPVGSNGQIPVADSTQTLGIRWDTVGGALFGTQSANVVFAGPASGAAAAPTFRGIVPDDLTTALLTPPAIGATTPNTGSFFSLTLTKGASAADANLVINAPAAQSKTITYYSALTSRWQQGSDATAESGSNVGSDYFIKAFSDVGALLFTPISIKRSTGKITIGTALLLSTLTTNNAFLYTDGSGNVAQRILLASDIPVISGTQFGTQTANTVFAGPASGGAANPTFRGVVSADLTTALTTPPAIGSTTPSSGVFTALSIIPAAGDSVLVIRRAAASFGRVNYYTGANLRWTLNANDTAEGGSNAGTNFEIAAYNDAGTLLFTPLTITRSTGVSGFSKPVWIGASAPTTPIGDMYLGIKGSSNPGLQVENSNQWVLAARSTTTFGVYDKTAGLDRLGVDTSGRWSLDASAFDAALSIKSPATGVIGLKVAPFSSGVTVDIFQAVNSSGNAIFSVNKDGISNFFLRNASTSSSDQAVVFYHATSGTPANGFGTDVNWNLDTNGSTFRAAMLERLQWADATDATRKAKLAQFLYDGGTARQFFAATVISGEMQLGFGAATPITRPDWTAWTGTASRATKATTTATAQDCAQAIMALIDDLISYGLFK